MEKELPDFNTWQHESLVRFCKDCYAALLMEQEANRQLRLDFKDAMQVVRIQLLKDNAS
jgi:hypothetical protein